MNRNKLGLAVCFFLLASSIAYAEQPSSGVSGSPPSVLLVLEAIGSNGENAYDMVKASDWMKAQTNLNSLHTAAINLRRLGGEAREEMNELDKTLDAMQKAVISKDRESALFEANRVTYLAAKMTEPLNPQVPIEVTLLDYFGRELEIWAASRNKDKIRKLKGTADSIRKTWDAVRPAVVRHGGNEEAQQFSKLVAQIEGARAPSDFGRLATSILDEVDNLELVFKKQ